MEGYKDTIPLYEQALNAAGTTTQKFALYQEGTEAAINRLTASMQGLWQNTFDSQGLRDAINGLTALVNGINSVVKEFGFLVPTVALASTAFFTFNRTALNSFIANLKIIPTAIGVTNLKLKEMIAQVGIAGVAVRGLTVAVNGLKAALSTFVPVAILTALAYGIQLVIDKWQEAKQQEKELKQYNDGLVQSYSAHGKEVDKLIERYKELKRIQSEGTLSLDQSEELIAIQNKLNQLMPQLTDSIDEQGNARLKNVELIEQELELARKLKDVSDQTTINEFDSKVEQQLNKIKDLQNQIKNLNEASSYYGSEDASNLESDKERLERTRKQVEVTQQLNKEYEEFNKLAREYIQASFEQSKGIESLNNETKKYLTNLINTKQFSSKEEVEEFKQNIDEQIKLINEASDRFEKFNNPTDKGKLNQLLNSLRIEFTKVGFTAKEADDIISHLFKTQDSYANSVNDVKNIHKQLIDTYFETSDSVKELNDALDKLASGHLLTSNEIQKLIERYPELINYYNIESGQLELTAAGIESVRNARVQEANAALTSYQQKLNAHKQALEADIQLYDQEIRKIDEVISKQAQLSTAGIMHAYMVKGELENRKKTAEDAIAEAQKTANAIQKIISTGFNFKTPNDKPAKSSSAKSEYTPLTREARELIKAENELARIRQEQAKWAEYSIQYRQSLSDERKELEKIISLKQQELATVEKTNKIGGKSSKIGGSAKDNDEAFKKAEDLRKEIDDLKNQLSEVATKEENATLAQYAKNIEDIDAALEANKDTLENLSTISKEYRDGLDYDISLLETKQTAYQQEISYLEKLASKYDLNTAKGKEYNDKLKQTKDALRDVNKELEDKKFAKFNSALEVNQDRIATLNDQLEQSKSRMSVLEEGSKEWTAELNNQNKILKEQISINQTMIDQIKYQLTLTPQNTKAYRDLEQQLRSLQSAQIGYNNAILQNNRLKSQIIDEQWQKKYEAEEQHARDIKDKLLAQLNKLINSDKGIFDLDAFRDKIKSILRDVKSAFGEIDLDFDVIDHPKIGLVDNIKDIDIIIEDYIKEIEKINEDINKLKKESVGVDEDLINNIGKEIKLSHQLKQNLQQANTLLEKRKQQYALLAKAMDEYLQKLEDEKNQILDSLRSKMEVPAEFDLEQIKDNLVELFSNFDVPIHDIGIDLSDATIIGDISSDIRQIISDILTDNENLNGITNEFEKQSSILKEQEDLRKKIIELEKQGKQETKEYTDLQKQLEDINKKALEARKEMQKLLEKEIDYLNELREEEKKIREEIQERESLYRQQEKALEQQIENTKKIYDEQIKQQQEKLKLLDEQIEREDRLIERARILQEIENVKKDKRFEYINANGEVELTYDKGRVAELEQKLADFDRETQRRDQRKQIEDEIDRLESIRDKEIERLEEYQKQLKETHDKEIAQLNFYLNQNKLLQDKAVYNINTHLSKLEQSYNKQIEFERLRFEQLKAIHEAEIAAMETYISALETQIDRINEDINSKIDILEERLNDYIDGWAEAATTLGGLVRDLKNIADQVSNIRFSSLPSISSSSVDLPKHHDGGIVGNKPPSKIVQIANKMFNAKPNEQVIKSLVGELQIPPINIAKNFIPAIQGVANQVANMVAGKGGTPTVVSQDKHYHFGDITVRANNPIEFFRGLDNIINANRK
jgi:hypothetical protein